MKKNAFLVSMILTFLFSETVYAKSFLVNPVDELNQIQPKVQPGDRILFSNKTWMDAQIKLTVSRTQTMPIWIFPTNCWWSHFFRCICIQIFRFIYKSRGFCKELFKLNII